MSTLATGRTQLASYSFDPAARSLHRNGDEILLSRKARALLALLLGNVNSLVPRDRILAEIWPEGFVQDGNLTQTVYLLRKALAADSNVTIENVPRRGYCLRLTEKQWPDTQRRRSTPFVVTIGTLMLIVLVGAGGWMSLRATGARQLPLSAREDINLATYHFDRFVDLRLARSHFERIMREAPGIPEGYAGSALVDAIDGYDSPDRDRYCAKGRAAVAHAIALGSSTLGHVARGMLDVTCDRSLAQARRELDEALAMTPSDPMALTVRSRIAVWQNQPRDAISFARKAVTNDPTSPEALLILGIAYYNDANFHNAVDTFQQLLELMPNRSAALEFLERSYDGLGDFANADKTLRKAQGDPSNASWVWPARARLLALTGRRDDAIAMLRARAGRSDPLSLAAAYTAMGADRVAIANLKVSASRHSLGTQLAWLNDFRFSALRRKHPEVNASLVTWR
ncbi:MAG TPA: winged helix-turn-helix domain-containing protein [Candidatus Cybelea sp.]|jgi:DNA-binding winged helix-turn-helix (wHTH) protein/Flp pilus assembly protein TadD|nr:winged helix-turn-helix domain-containing protein [Candidatus Cybelea sp.]